MAKRAIFFLLTLLLTVLLILQACFFVAAEDNTNDITAESTGNAAEETGDTLFSTEPATVSKAQFPVLTVSAISNYFGRIDAEYNEFTREITVVYMLKSSKRILSADWTLTYDPELLTIDPEKNTAESICAVTQDNALINLDAAEGKLHFAATDLHLFDFSTGVNPFVQIVFDVAELTAEDSEITKIDLSMNDLIVSEPNPETGESLAEKEIVLVANGKSLKSNGTKTVQASKYTTLTPSTFVEPSPASQDQALTTAPLTTMEPTVTSAPVTQPKPKAAAGKQEPEPLIYTGTWYVSLLILMILLGCSIVLFVMRKRDIYNS